MITYRTTTKKRTAILLLGILALGALGFGGYKVADGIISKKKAEEEIVMKYTAISNYRLQYEAFYDLPLEEYRAYEKRYEWELQTRIIYYIKKTGKTITLGDVETFLATPKNPDGTPRTWVDDETGIVKDFVSWCNKNGDDLDQYTLALRHILTDYRNQHRDCPYCLLEDLSPEQIIELDKKYEDPDYELVLEW